MTSVDGYKSCDYDEHQQLQARIRDLEESLAKYQACRVHDVDEKAYLSKRVRALEAALLTAVEDYETHNGRPKPPHWVATSRLLLTAA